MTLLELEGQGDYLTWVSNGSGERLSLRDIGAVDSLIASQAAPLYLDITGLAVGVWAPLIARVVPLGVPLRVLYTEPATYARSDVPTPGKVFDLSERIEGIAPIPSFASIRRVDRSDVALVPILGFEGARLEFVLAHEELPPDQVFPILGAPGFRLEYPTFALLGNKTALLQYELAQQVSLAKASCPFELFASLKRVADESGAKHLRVAPIGTKPHALGAVLFALARRAGVDILYDNALPRDGSSTGASRVWTYFVSEFVQSQTFRGMVA